MLKEEYDQGNLLDKSDMPHIVNWMAYGYQKAGRRYLRKDIRKRGIGFYEIAYSLFEKIESEADKLLKHAEEGMELTVKVNRRSLEAELRLSYPGEEEYY